ncbi:MULTISPECIES: hypothetical protein [unclassified Moorena]|uniref:hypothetical protein n=2 Tax=Moorena TaxID=1155738 RepID=UPI0013FF9391|nr:MULTISPECIES: hypothetical protein [unclassified Moorena]NEO16981.1 hypothetical protein [Moorena sp. SIO3E8]NEQ03581.1 hypothetical protein [Moorena sp. SIO3F7]NEQ62229.1 hypothetical protein [Moorena sp. SIO4A1]
MNPNNPDQPHQLDRSDPYQQILFAGYTEQEIAEIETLIQTWDKATYPTLANSIVDHADRHGFKGNYLKYLKKAANFNKKGSRKTQLPNGALRWNKGTEFLIERDNKIISYG